MLAQKILWKVPRQNICHSKHYHIADKIILLLPPLLWTEMLTVCYKILTAQEHLFIKKPVIKLVAKPAKLSGPVFLLFHATEKYAGCLKKCFQDAYCLTVQTPHNCRCRYLYMG